MRLMKVETDEKKIVSGLSRKAELVWCLDFSVLFPIFYVDWRVNKIENKLFE